MVSESVQNRNIYITNSTSTTINYSISADGANWFSYSLSPQRQASFTLNTIYIYVASLNGSVTYSLAAGNFYYFGWNDEKQKWDVFTNSR